MTEAQTEGQGDPAEQAATVLQQMEGSTDPAPSQSTTESSPQEAVYPVTMPSGEVKQVPITELQELASKGADYTRKTQETSDLRKEAEEALRYMSDLKSNPEAVYADLGRILNKEAHDKP